MRQSFRTERESVEGFVDGVEAIVSTHNDSAYLGITPIKYRMITITRMVPSPPLGPYPHFALCGHVGSEPMTMRMSTMKRMVESDMLIYRDIDGRRMHESSRQAPPNPILVCRKSCASSASPLTMYALN